MASPAPAATQVIAIRARRPMGCLHVDDADADFRASLLSGQDDIGTTRNGLIAGPLP